MPAWRGLAHADLRSIFSRQRSLSNGVSLNLAKYDSAIVKASLGRGRCVGRVVSCTIHHAISLADIAGVTWRDDFIFVWAVDHSSGAAEGGVRRASSQQCHRSDCISVFRRQYLCLSHGCRDYDLRPAAHQDSTPPCRCKPVDHDSGARQRGALRDDSARRCDVDCRGRLAVEQSWLWRCPLSSVLDSTLSPDSKLGHLERLNDRLEEGVAEGETIWTYHATIGSPTCKTRPHGKRLNR